MTLWKRLTHYDCMDYDCMENVYRYYPQYQKNTQDMK